MELASVEDGIGPTAVAAMREGRLKDVADQEEQNEVSKHSTPAAIRRSTFVFTALAVIAGLVVAFLAVVANWYDVPTRAMMPSILPGDRIIVNKIAYGLRFPFSRWHLVSWKEPALGDLVALWSPEDDKLLVERVIGLPGEVIEIRDNKIYRNGESAAYHPFVDDPTSKSDLQENVALYTEELGGHQHVIMIAGSGLHPPGPFRVPEDAFFVMGDNRNNSRDSRYFGPVSRSRILGQVTSVAWSLDPQNDSRPRSGRFLKPLD